ncbi:methionyl-tRNA formyltransferase [Acidiphilium acidophilum]|uniref:Methionyl-tRNA formyltransferase n=1 Tax=Acidiphilium acidophilum TaxID=76588 RepID=A0AAW9DP33_ACIAO|nr:methionyl-tRNA formyltransferase [Acidiphilium acidophilum]MDX5930836.1 methionyl-tRNA formyltransferase [Acidiphilium acidophilum]GBQ23992.1 methionyl-tRNA formyl transferase [Acidiphilium acidophilum DSM 700]
MRLVFMGSPGFALPALRGLRAAGHEIAAVYCQSPKPVGRGLRVRKCAVHEAADELGIEVRTPRSLRNNAGEIEYLRGLDAECCVVVAYGLILPEAVLAVPRRGCLNIHASLLPRWRGAAPIQAAILAGDACTGVTIMQMDAGLDTGAILLTEATPIAPDDTAATLHDRLAAMGARLVVQVIDGDYVPVAQQGAGSYAPKLSRADAEIDWTLPVAAIDRRVRGLTPWPGTETRLDGEPLKILSAVVGEGQGKPGTVLDHRLTVACGAGALRVTAVKRAGGRPMSADDFLRGHAIPPGTLLG